jgi:hypothetical protein
MESSMLRIALIGVGVVTAAVTGWIVKRQFFSATDDVPPVVIQMPQIFRPGSRRKRGQRVEAASPLETGEGSADPVA